MAVTISRTNWIDDSGDGTSGTVINNAEKQALYNQIDGALALLLPLTGGTISGALTLNGDLVQSRNVAYAVGVGRLGLFRNTHASDPVGLIVNYSNAAPNNTGNEFIQCTDSAGFKFGVRSNGGIANFSANNVNLSDDSMKDYDAPLTDADIKKEAAAFLSLDLRRGRYKGTKDKTLMFSAQQVEATKKEWAGVFDQEHGLKGIKEHAILMAAYATIRQLDKRVTALEAA